MFSLYKKLEYEQLFFFIYLFMGNDVCFMVEVHGPVVLKFTSGKIVTLNEVMPMLGIMKRLSL